jgi:hypothetical protein
MHQNDCFIAMLSKMLQHVLAFQRYNQEAHMILTSYLYVGVHYRKIMEYRVKLLQLVLLHYGYKWIWLTAAGSSVLYK